MIQLRAARITDAPLLKKWCLSVGMWSSAFDWESEIPRVVEWRELLVAQEHGTPVGFVQLLDANADEDHYWADAEPGVMAIDIWVGDPDNRNRGVGTRIMELAIKRCFIRVEVNAIVIDPLETNLAAHRFYERLGFRYLEMRQFGKNICRIYQLNRPGWVT